MRVCSRVSLQYLHLSRPRYLIEATSRKHPSILVFLYYPTFCQSLKPTKYLLRQASFLVRNCFRLPTIDVRRERIGGRRQHLTRGKRADKRGRRIHILLWRRTRKFSKSSVLFLPPLSAASTIRLSWSALCPSCCLALPSYALGWLASEANRC